MTRWLVSSPHGVLVVTDGERSWVPYSERHAREVGGALTVCGLFAIGWELFWDQPFDVDDADVCTSCADLVSRTLARPGSRDGLSR